MFDFLLNIGTDLLTEILIVLIKIYLETALNNVVGVTSKRLNYDDDLL